MNTVLEIWRRRVHKFFSQPALYLLRFLNPAENQNSWSREEREALLELLVTCIRHYCTARQLAFDDDEVKYDLGKFLMRTGKFSLEYEKFWIANVASAPCLSRFAVALGNISVTEAAVERSFKEEAKLLNKHRANLSEETTEALLCVDINYRKVFQPERVQQAASIAQQRRNKHSEKSQKTLENIFMQKRIKPNPTESDI